MARRTTEELIGMFARAEHEGRCLLVRSDTQRKALLRRRDADQSDAERLAPSVYARISHLDNLSPRASVFQLIRALALKHPEWVFCGLSAAILHGLYVSYSDIRPQDKLVVHVMGSKRRAEYDRFIVQPHRPPPYQARIVRVQEAQATDELATAVACARTLPFPKALAIMDSLLRFSSTDRERALRELERVGAHARGVAVTQRAILHANGASENGGESIARGIMIEEGFQEPELQVPIYNALDDEDYYVDFVWHLSDGSMVFGEFDGGEKFSSEEMRDGKSVSEVARDERLRESRLTLHGTPVLRFTPRMLNDRAGFVRLLNAYGVPRNQS